MARSSNKSRPALKKQQPKQQSASAKTSNEPIETDETSNETPEPETTPETETPDENQPQEPDSSDSTNSDDEQGGSDDQDDTDDAGDGAQDDENGPESDEQPEQVSQEPETAPEPAEGQPRSHGAVPDGIIIEPGAPVRVEAEVQGNVALVTKTVYQRKQLPRSQRSTYVLLYRKGSVIPTNVLNRINKG